MRKFNIILVLFAFLAMALGFTACSDGDVSEKEYVSKAEKICKQEAKNQTEEDEATSASECISDLKELLQDHKDNWPKCLQDFLNMYGCAFDHPEKEGEEETTCIDESIDYMSCMETNYDDEDGLDDH